MSKKKCLLIFSCGVVCALATEYIVKSLQTKGSQVAEIHVSTNQTETDNAESIAKMNDESISETITATTN